MEKQCFFKGEVRPLSDVSIRVDDIGFLRGYGVFEVLRTYSFKPFLLDRHLDRLESSAGILGLSRIPSRDEISAGMDRLIAKFPDKEVSLRIVLTGGTTPDGISLDPSSSTFLIVAEEFIGPDDKVYDSGVTLFPVEHRRVFPRAKTTNYIFPIKAKMESEERGFFDLLYTSDGTALESSTSNFFIVKDNKLITPKDDVLMGTTRDFVIEIARPHFRVEERVVSVDEIDVADEAFITATNKEIIPVIRVGDTVVGSGTAGKTTKKLINLFKERVMDHEH